MSDKYFVFSCFFQADFLPCNLVKYFKKEKRYVEHIFAIYNLEIMKVIYEQENTFSSLAL